MRNVGVNVNYVNVTACLEGCVDTKSGCHPSRHECTMSIQRLYFSLTLLGANTIDAMFKQEQK